VGGFWGAELKHAGWDAIVVTGQAAEPVYLWIQDDGVEIRPAAHLWGRKTADVEAILRAEVGDARLRVAQCGVAGENRVRYACIVNDLHHAAGRTGLGAVMGAKKLKAVVVRGSGKVDLADRDSVLKTAGQVRALRAHWAWFREHGTGGALRFIDAEGALPTRNFQAASFEGAGRITGERISETMLAGRGTCYACPIECKRKARLSGRFQVDPAYGGPEYETLASLGACCGIDDLQAIVYANQLCNAYGLDTISTGLTIAWAMECSERGLLTGDDTGGLRLRFGDAAAMTALVDQIAHRQGFGDLLAEGSLRAARQTGRGTERYAMQVKGQEIPPSYDPRTRFALGLGYATSPTGADHMHSFKDHYSASDSRIAGMQSWGILEPLAMASSGPEKVRIAKYHVDWQVFHNCLGMCMFLPYGDDQLRDIVRSVTGWNSTVFELMKVGERALVMAHVLNHRAGFRPRDDTMPLRFSLPIETGPAQGASVAPEEVARARELYYEMCGRDTETGAPTAAKLYELGLGWLNE
jgi:aldehyde:ferredoxin oxidoreductase